MGLQSAPCPSHPHPDPGLSCGPGRPRLGQEEGGHGPGVGAPWGGNPRDMGGWAHRFPTGVASTHGGLQLPTLLGPHPPPHIQVAHGREHALGNLRKRGGCWPGLLPGSAGSALAIQAGVEGASWFWPPGQQVMSPAPEGTCPVWGQLEAASRGRLWVLACLPADSSPSGPRTPMSFGGSGSRALCLRDPAAPSRLGPFSLPL